MEQKPTLINFILIGTLFLFFAVILLSTICFYATTQKDFFFQTLQVLSALAAVGSTLDSIRLFVRLRRTTFRDRQGIATVSISILDSAILTAFTIASVMGYIPPSHFPWILPVAILAIPLVLKIGHEPLNEKETSAIIQFFFGAIFAGALTWGQIALIEHFDTWLFLRIGFIPIPVLGITVVLSALFSAFCILVTACAIVFHTLRLSYSVK